MVLVSCFSTDTGNVLTGSSHWDTLVCKILSFPYLPDPIDQFIIKSLMSFLGVLKIENSLGSHLQCNDQSVFSPLIREHMDTKSADTSGRLLQATRFQANDLPAEPPCSAQQCLRLSLVWSLPSHRQH